MKPSFPTLDGVEKARKVIHPYLPVTPLVKSELLSQTFDADIWLKYETVTPISSFKIRGAINAVSYAKEQAITGVVTSSTGNHGQGVAYAARVSGLTANIFLPKPANPIKAKMIEAFGGLITEDGSDIDEAKNLAHSFAEKNYYHFIDDGEDVLVMEGAGTVAYEISSELDNIDYLLVPLGGGNLSAGCASTLKSLQPQAKIITVQAKGSPAVTESFHARSPIERPIDSIADGLVTRVPPKLALDVLLKFLDDAWLATDEDLLAAVHTLVASAHVLVEPAGAAGLVGAWNNKHLLRGKRVVLILTGSNISSQLLNRALMTPPLIFN